VIFVRPRYERALRKLTASQQTLVNAALLRLETAFGRPHEHSGLGLRPFGRYFEMRIGLGLRVLFLSEKGDIFLCFVGNHDEVRAFIKQGS
jgi:mRNA-degrading endonuclease RelE of RelBE toxin-antitoxin system